MHVYSTYMYNLASPVNAILSDLCEMEVGELLCDGNLGNRQ